MIVVEAVEPDSDGVSATTLIAAAELPRVPTYFPNLIWLSSFIALLSLILVLVGETERSFGGLLLIPNILAFVFLIPYNCAALLLQWLSRHQTESIFRFSPCSTRAIAYSVFLAVLWAGSTTTSILMAPYYWLDFHYPGGWDSILGPITSAIEMLLIVIITTICWRHRKINRNSASSISPPIPLSTPAPQSKVLSA